LRRPCRPETDEHLASALNLLVSAQDETFVQGEASMDSQHPRATIKTPASAFTGDVYMTPIYSGQSPSHMTVALVRFTPGAHTDWHSHAVGQSLHVSEGVGLVGTRDGTVVRVRAGDTVICPPREDSWHGATADTCMSHFTLLQTNSDGPDPTTRSSPSAMSSTTPPSSTGRITDERDSMPDQPHQTKQIGGHADQLRLHPARAHEKGERDPSHALTGQLALVAGTASGKRAASARATPVRESWSLGVSTALPTTAAIEERGLDGPRTCRPTARAGAGTP
jgi:quercetin dioxygenase-like cupin family protein